MYFKILLLIAFILYMPIAHSAAVTYTFSGGRFGDNLLAYCHAKWISYKYNIPLLYKPFDYSDHLMMHTLEQHYSQTVVEKFDAVLYLKNTAFIKAEKNILYIVSYFPESAYELARPEFAHYFFVDWQDKIFKKELQKMICPVDMLPTITLPANYISTAVHVRKGTGFDIASLADFNTLCVGCPIKCPPDSYYLEQLEQLSCMFPDRLLYVYIFTDHTDPEEIVLQYKQALDKPFMVFDYQKQPIDYNTVILADFFNMMHFDCLIRSDSNFSLVSSKLGNHQLVIYPSGYTILENQVTIDQVTLIRKTPSIHK